MIGVLGNSNAGKSTLINAIIGEKLLPTASKCCTSVITNVSYVKIGESILTKSDGSTYRGKKSIRDEIKRLNSQARNSDEPPVDVSLSCDPKKHVGDRIPRDGRVKLVDLPGANEKDNAVVKACIKQALSMCTAVFLIAAPKELQSEGLATLIENIEEFAPHLLTMDGAVTFVISQIDTARCDESDSGSDGESVHQIEGHKRVFREFLRKRLPEHEAWVEKAVILATSVNENGIGGNDFDKIIGIIEEVHKKLPELYAARKKVLATRIHAQFEEHFVYNDYPVHAKCAIGAEEQNQTRWIRVAVLSSIVTVPLGGMAFMATSSVKGAMAGAALLASILSFDSSQRAVTLGGEVLIGLPHLKAEGVAVAIQRMHDKMKMQSIDTCHIKKGYVYCDILERKVEMTRYMKKCDLDVDSSNSTYRLTAVEVEKAGYCSLEERSLPFYLTKCGSDIGPTEDTMSSNDAWRGGYDEGDGWIRFNIPLRRAIYVGEFKGKKPNGSGRLFWPRTGMEAYIGTFENGLPVSGVFINEAGFYVGQLEQQVSGWEIRGFQADLPEGEDAVCNVCMDKPAMFVENYIMHPCGHGHTCRECEKNLTPKECPTCRTPIESLMPF